MQVDRRDEGMACQSCNERKMRSLTRHHQRQEADNAAVVFPKLMIMALHVSHHVCAVLTMRCLLFFHTATRVFILLSSQEEEEEEEEEEDIFFPFQLKQSRRSSKVYQSQLIGTYVKTRQVYTGFKSTAVAVFFVATMSSCLRICH
ncbi:hypothetical protein OIU85_006865 [Salix viminalis]|uniref:Uncharacterized protein n=1 Tax=Salix viminalis TaxID=40686 RepID=A0A9Q0PM48_SALVM|nr:hypothetical protein OIU85_006865 [Salix viminalis]